MPKSEFVKRQEELKKLQEHITNGYNVLIVGMPGVGKTCLLEQLKTDQSQSYVFWVELKDITDEADFWRSLTIALPRDCRPDKSDDAYVDFKDALQKWDEYKKPGIFLLDDFEFQPFDSDIVRWLPGVLGDLYKLQRQKDNIVFVAAVRPGALTRSEEGAEKLPSMIRQIFGKFLWLSPLSYNDAEVLAQKLTNNSDISAKIAEKSGGLPRLIKGLVAIPKEKFHDEDAVLLKELISADISVLADIWEDLNTGTREVLKDLANDQRKTIGDDQSWWFTSIGIITEGKLFSPLFKLFISKYKDTSIQTSSIWETIWEDIQRSWIFTLFISFLLWCWGTAVGSELLPANWGFLGSSIFGAVVTVISIPLFIRCRLWPGPGRMKRLLGLWAIISLAYLAFLIYLIVQESLWFLLIGIGTLISSSIFLRILAVVDRRNMRNG